MEQRLVEELPSRPPRRPRTGYAYFVQQHYRGIYNERTIQDPRDVLRRLAAIWKELTEQEKGPYKKMSKNDAVRYKEEKAEWIRAYGGRPPKTQHKKRDVDHPKRTKNAFIFYEQSVWKETRDAHPMMGQREIVQQIGRQWREMTEEQKEPYFAKARKDKLRYQKEKAEYLKRKKEMSMTERTERMQQEQNDRPMVPDWQFEDPRDVAPAVAPAQAQPAPQGQPADNAPPQAQPEVQPEAQQPPAPRQDG